MDQRAYRALGVTSARRTRWLPQLPSIAEFVPGYDVDPWYGVRVPGGTADAVVRRIHSEVVRIAKLPDVGRRSTTDGGEVVANAPSEFAALIEPDFDKWGQVARKAGLDLQ